MLERDIERRLVSRIKAMGGLCMKFTSPGRASVPDRIVMLPKGDMLFVELKRPGEKATAAQAREHQRYRDLGNVVLVINSYEQIDEHFAAP